MQDDLPLVSIIIPAYRSELTLNRCLASVLAQDLDSFEVVLCLSADRERDIPAIEQSPRLRVLTSVPRLSAAEARNRAVADARGELLAFIDADVLATEGWLSALVDASSAGTRCVGGSVANGTPESAVGTAEYLVQFLDLHPARPARTAWHGATCNLLVPRNLWDRFGPFPEDMNGGEDTLLTTELRAAGSFVFHPGAVVTHLNRTDMGTALRHQFQFGVFTAILARRANLKFGTLTRYPVLAPIALGGRIVSLYARVFAWAPKLLLRSISLAPLILALLSAWSAGLAVEGLRRWARPAG